MKFNQTNSGFLAICMVCVLLACKEEILVPDLKGSLVGYVYTFDEYANTLDDHSGVLVTAYGMELAAFRHTDANGRFEFRQLPAGTYELHIEKTGFGTMKQFGVQHLGGRPTTLGLAFSGSANSQAFFIYKLPTTQIVNLSVVNDTLSGEFIFTGEPREYISLRIYFSDEPDFIASEAVKVINRTLFNNSGNFSCRIWSIYELPFEAGETVHFKASIYTEAWLYMMNRSINGIDTYVDLESNQIIYPNLGDESDQFSFVFPE
jgi:hypothetical protein